VEAYTVLARNSARDSENKIHDDRVAAQFGYRGGLVPGVTVFGYLTVPVVRRFGEDWLHRGMIRVKFVQPVYDGESLTARLADGDEIRAEGPGGEIRAAGAAAASHHAAGTGVPEAALPAPEARPAASDTTIQPGVILGSLRPDLAAEQQRWLEILRDPLPLYRQWAHPAALLSLANDILIRNFLLGPWIHTASEVYHFRAARISESAVVRGRIAECYQRKGRDWLVLEVVIAGADGAPIQSVRHTAIWRWS
jgi:hypothetical protein